MRIAAWLIVALVACKKNVEHREAFQAEGRREFARYEDPIAAFFAATSSKSYDRAYDMLAPSYTNMVSKERFLAVMQGNHNFDKPLTAECVRWHNVGATTTVECGLGELGRTDVTFLNGPDRKIASIAINGMQALPAP